ncbi:hypothetical protein Psi01_79640 [Planobispora siamensis]|uniref:Putative glutamate--cysteine ligase 2 n=2 Tax=Planobispora siamensis TaxID=936338 RepID=A0A8J3SQ61_9ACTN|nr:hypothetical protein Psi01_79640 [Planobispora siamensis]
MGVEEEFFLLEPHTGQTVPAVEQILAGIGSHELLQREIAACQIETATHPHTDLATLRRQLTGLRAELAGAARQTGCRLVASGTAPLEHSANDALLTDDPRYRRIAHAYGATSRGEKCCGCHVHIEVPDREEAVQVGNHLRPWLPTLLALTANSPFTAGADSGYASWRAMTWGRWPSAALPPYLQDAAEHETVVASLIGSGAILDEAMLYWLVRPSHHLPTVEVRVADVCATAAEAALFAAVVRGLVMSVLSDIRAGRPATGWRDRGWNRTRPAWSRPGTWSRTCSPASLRRWRRPGTWARSATGWPGCAFRARGRPASARSTPSGAPWAMWWRG